MIAKPSRPRPTQVVNTVSYIARVAVVMTWSSGANNDPPSAMR